LFDVVQSVDSLRVAEALAAAAFDAQTTIQILIQVRLGDESTKHGVDPQLALDLVEQSAALPGLEVAGLMGIAPRAGDPRPHYRRLRELFDRLPAAGRRVLSMGMSSDYRVAIEEGSTLIRIGTALFGPR